MQVIITNENGIEERTDINVVNLEDNDLIIVKIPDRIFKAHAADKFAQKFRNTFPNNKIIFVADINDIVIVKQSQRHFNK